MEAFHWQFHPAAHVWRALLESGKYGKIVSTNSKMTASPGVPHGDIRWQFDLAGGSLMDATYALSFTRYALRAGVPEEVVTASARPYDRDPRVDAAMNATMIFKDQEGRSVHSSMYTDIGRSWLAGVIPRVWELPQIEVETEKANIMFYNAMMPHRKSALPYAQHVLTLKCTITLPSPTRPLVRQNTRNNTQEVLCGKT